ncbi:hypothetical protein GCM10010964_05670 [Caldovatus sediminis]|uniref:WYL domain-containing protein n=1 Tax=Caldovatus sediminis TaxID=2041189 RepID=A0A8J2Z8J2_9PROT|nr:hypothetical protein GCM10010964_05670 [Caldovatus sediminis]
MAPDLRRLPAGIARSRPGLGNPDEDSFAASEPLRPEDDHGRTCDDPRLAERVAWLTAAIRARRALHLLYGGSWRVVHPPAVGRTSRGKTVLLAWQTAGLGRSGEHEGWRMFDVARIAAAEELRATFTPRPRTPRAGEAWTPGIRRPISALRAPAPPGFAPRPARGRLRAAAP